MRLKRLCWSTANLLGGAVWKKIDPFSGFRKCLRCYWVSKRKPIDGWHRWTAHNKAKADGPALFKGSSFDCPPSVWGFWLRPAPLPRSGPEYSPREPTCRPKRRSVRYRIPAGALPICPSARIRLPGRLPPRSRRPRESDDPVVPAPGDPVHVFGPDRTRPTAGAGLFR
jgi:hypothetical protein